MKPTDLITGKNIYFDEKTFTYIGLKQVILNSISDLMEFVKKVEKLRYTDSTKMNSTSSRSFAIIEFRVYIKEGDNLKLNWFRFVDMPGSERAGKAGVGETA